MRVSTELHGILGSQSPEAFKIIGIGAEPSMQERGFFWGVRSNILNISQVVGIQFEEEDFKGQERQASQIGRSDGQTVQEFKG